MPVINNTNTAKSSCNEKVLEYLNLICHYTVYCTYLANVPSVCSNFLLSDNLWLVLKVTLRELGLWFNAPEGWLKLRLVNDDVELILVSPWSVKSNFLEWLVLDAVDVLVYRISDVRGLSPLLEYLYYYVYACTMQRQLAHTWNKEIMTTICYH